MFRGLRPDEIEVRVGTVGKKGASMLLYKDARCDMNILDETYGSEFWQRDHKQVKDNMYAGIGIYNKELKEWVWKWDCGTESNTEKEKGEASDSFKRACFNLGIGRELYTGGLIFIPCETEEIGNTNKYKLKDPFLFSGVKVTDVQYKEDNGKRFITGITICDRKGNKMFPTTGYRQPPKKDDPQPTTKDLKEIEKVGAKKIEPVHIAHIESQLIVLGKDLDAYLTYKDIDKAENITLDQFTNDIKPDLEELVRKHKAKK